VFAQHSEIQVGVAAETVEAGFLSVLSRRLRSDPMGLAGLLMVLSVLFCAGFSHWLAPYDPFKIHVDQRFIPPSWMQIFGAGSFGDGLTQVFTASSWMHFFGTDTLGRDVLSRVIAGSRIALSVGGGSIAIALAIGLVLGLTAGYGPRWLDNLLLLLFDSVYSFPTVILGLTVMTLLEPSIETLVFVVVVIQTPAYSRLIRTATLSIKNSEYILAVRSLGASPARILLVHILPNIVGPLFIIASMDIPSVIALEAGLTYLGLGIPPPAPSWGRILQEGYSAIRDAPWIVIAGGIPLIITTLGFTFLGEALRDWLDPKLRRIV
jgi:peptide/nickel transport system permease protein